jgi:ubiquinone/menaquinone biosynthesis C-methylase UbiE
MDLCSTGHGEHENKIGDFMGWPKGVPRKPVAVLEGEEVGPYVGQKDLRISFKKSREGFITEDFVDSEDIELPFEDDSVKEMVFDNLLQFVKNLVPLMNEVQRTLSPNGTVTIVIPMYPHRFCFNDPMTVRVFNDITFSYFHEGNPFWIDIGKGYGIKPFKVFNQSTNGPYLTVVLRK